MVISLSVHNGHSLHVQLSYTFATSQFKFVTRPRQVQAFIMRSVLRCCCCLFIFAMFCLLFLQAVKQFIDLCNNIGSTCTPRRNISQTTAVKFLYARKFDVPRAVSLYEQHEQIRLKEGLYNIDPDVEPLRSELQTGKFTILVSDATDRQTDRQTNGSVVLSLFFYIFVYPLVMMIFVVFVVFVYLLGC